MTKSLNNDDDRHGSVTEWALVAVFLLLVAVALVKAFHL
jgi:hypothetical protein